MYVLLLDIDKRAATLVLNGILEHRTSLADDGSFRFVPSWLRESMRIGLEARMRDWARREALPPVRKTRPVRRHVRFHGRRMGASRSGK